MPELGVVSEALLELERVRRIEDPTKRAAEFRKLVPRLRETAFETKDREIIEIVNEFARVEEDSRVFYEAQSLDRFLRDLRQNLQKARSFLSRDVVNRFLVCIEEFHESLVSKQRRLQPSVEVMFFTLDQLTNQLVGRRLEKEITPSLLKQMGYDLGPTIYTHNDTEIEIDALGEKIETSAPEGQGKILEKEILIVECKRSVTKKDVIDFFKKVKVIAEKYEQIAQILKHQLRVESWIIACYGWTDELKKLSREKGITPIDKDYLENLLRRHRLLDRRLPVCPENIET